ncbi:MAG: excinuclease ABC subunit UvrA [Bacteriovoracaceae bacterium]|nr:excinuclease ABC subunit UvrA [Bacteriovoracaceae bacterium]
MSSADQIEIFHAREHNLKDISVNLPKNALTVITGPSGSGKSSLAFDTIFREGQRRYMASLSIYARQFLGQSTPPAVESIRGLSPAIAISQQGRTSNPRSTVGTITEIYDFLRILFSRVGSLYDIHTGEQLQRYTPTQMAHEILKLPPGTKVQILSPQNLGAPAKRKKLVLRLLDQWQRLGFSRIYGHGEILDLETALAKTKADFTWEELSLIVDRLLLKDSIKSRLIQATEQALKLGTPTVQVLVGDENCPPGKKGPTILFFPSTYQSSNGDPLPDFDPHCFSFNAPQGACPACHGLGQSEEFDPQLMIENANLSLSEGAIRPLLHYPSLWQMVEQVAKKEKIDLTGPFKKLPKSFLDLLFKGSDQEYNFKFQSAHSDFAFKKKFPGIVNFLQLERQKHSTGNAFNFLQQFITPQVCPACQGGRLNPWALAVKINQLNIAQVAAMTVAEAITWTKNLVLAGEKQVIAEKITAEILSRLRFLEEVGLPYLQLNRAADSLSGGEMQRIRLATQMGAGLSGVLYVLDEPSIGLHAQDMHRLIKAMLDLKNQGNTVIVVEHDAAVMQHADYLIDLGPGAGTQGGQVIAAGTLDEIKDNPQSLTGRYLTGKVAIAAPTPAPPAKTWLHLKKVCCHNLKNVAVKIPWHRFVCISGPSGSGKSTLIYDVLLPALKAYLAHRPALKGQAELKTDEELDGIRFLDQSPLGKSAHSNPATYTGIFNEIRALLAATPQAQMKGFDAGRFSFNLPAGRCPTCQGHGVNKVALHFMPDLEITCPECHGTRFNPETLSVLYRGKNVAQILDLTIQEAGEFFQHHPRLKQMLQTMLDLGLGHLTLGQSATTLSGGEAQRVRLATELGKMAQGHYLYVLDEPTTGLHFADIDLLLKAFAKLKAAGHSIIVIEHNLDVLRHADYLIDLGPGGGDQGGKVMATGTPAEVAQVPESPTGKFLKH